MLPQSEGEKHHLTPPHLGEGLQGVDLLQVSLSNVTIVAVSPAPLDTKYEGEGWLDLSPSPPVRGHQVEAELELDECSLSEKASLQLMFTDESQTAGNEELSSVILEHLLQQDWHTAACQDLPLLVVPGDGAPELQ